MPLKGPSNLPSISQPAQAKKPKKTLFDEDDEKPLVPEKKI